MISVWALNGLITKTFFIKAVKPKTRFQWQQSWNRSCYKMFLLLTRAYFKRYLYSCLHLNCHFRHNLILPCTLSKKFVLWSFFPDNSSVIMTDSEVEYNAFQVLFEPSMQWIVFVSMMLLPSSRHSSTFAFIDSSIKTEPIKIEPNT